MSKAILIIGESGSGKTTSLRNLPPDETFYIDADGKGLSWKGWRNQYNKQKKNYLKTDDPDTVYNIMREVHEKQKQFKYLLITAIVMLGIVKIILNPGGVLAGTMLPVILVYMIGAYIRKYVTIKPVKYCFVKYILLTAIATLLYIILSVIVKQIDNNTIYSLIKKLIGEFREYSNILIIAMTVLIFIKFKTMTIKSNFIEKIITFISPSVFSIYLIHQSINIRDTMWLKMGIMDYANSWLMIPYILLMIITVFIVCLFIDLIMRGLYFGIKKIPIVNKIVKKSNDKLDKINLRLNNYITD